MSFESIYGFILGAMFGSVANALIYRIPKGISWSKGRSMCVKCNHELKFFDLLPIISFLSLRGKCRYCKKAISVRYVLVEILMAICFGLIFANGFELVNFLLAVSVFLSVVIAVMDWETKLVSEIVVLLWGGVNLGIRFVGENNFDLTSIIISVLVGLLIIGSIWLFTKGRAMGFGDVEIVAAMGVLLSVSGLLVAIWIAFIVGALVGIYMLWGKKVKNMKAEIAFGPFLIIGTWVSYLVGDMIVRNVFFI